MMAVVADLVINKPLRLSPPGIEFKRAHLWDINPVGVGAMALASVLSITAHLGVFGPLAQAFSALIALGTALVASPLLAWATGGKYYLARGTDEAHGAAASRLPRASRAVRWAKAEAGRYQRLKVQHCVICEREYEGPDMAHCPAYQGAICSLCCTLDAPLRRSVQAACEPVVAMVDGACAGCCRAAAGATSTRGSGTSCC